MEAEFGPQNKKIATVGGSNKGRNGYSLLSLLEWVKATTEEDLKLLFHII